MCSRNRVVVSENSLHANLQTTGPVSYAITVTMHSVVHSRWPQPPCPACFVSHQRLASVVSPGRPFAPSPPLHCAAVASLGPSVLLFGSPPSGWCPRRRVASPASSSRHEPSQLHVSRVSSPPCVYCIIDAVVRVPRHRRATSLADCCVAMASWSLRLLRR